MVGNLAFASICFSYKACLRLYVNVLKTKQSKIKDCQQETANGFTLIYGYAQSITNAQRKIQIFASG